MSGSVSAGSLAIVVSADSAGLTRDMAAAAAAVENGTARMNRAASQVTGLNAALSKSQAAAGSAGGAMDLLSVGLEKLASVAEGTRFAPLLTALGDASGKLAAVTAASAAGESGFALLATRVAAFASLAVALPVALQAVGLGINAAGTGAQTAAGHTKTYGDALTALETAMMSAGAKADMLAAKLADTAYQATQLQGQLALGSVFEQRSALISNEAALHGKAAEATRVHTDALRALNQLGEDDARRPAAMQAVAVRAAAAAKAAKDIQEAQARFAALNDEEKKLTERMPMMVNGGIRIVAGDAATYGPQVAASDTPKKAGGGGGAAEIDADLALATERLKEFLKLQDGAREAFDKVAVAVDPLAAAFDAYTERLQTLEFALLNGAASQDEFNEAAARTNTRLAEDIAKIDKPKEQADNAEKVFSKLNSSFEQVAFSGKGFGDTMNALAEDLAKMVLRLTIMEPLVRAVKAAFTGAGGMEGIMQTAFGMSGGSNAVPTNQLGASSADALYASMPASPTRAIGGPVSRNSSYLVGENGPEIFTPGAFGNITPNHAMGGGGATISIDARGAEAGVEARIEAALARRVPDILAASRMDLSTRVNRGGADARLFGRR